MGCIETKVKTTTEQTCTASARSFYMGLTSA